MTIEDDIGLLEQVPTFAALGRDALRVLAIGAESRVLIQGEVLFKESEPADSGYVVEEGLLTATPSGRRASPISFRRGALIGELSLITATQRPVTITAAEPSSVMRIPRPLFLKMLQGFPSMAERLRDDLLARTQQLANELDGVRRVLGPDIAPAPPPGNDITRP
jgi:CRP-like cAMP-binding protein